MAVTEDDVLKIWNTPDPEPEVLTLPALPGLPEVKLPEIDWNQIALNGMTPKQRREHERSLLRAELDNILPLPNGYYWKNRNNHTSKTHPNIAYSLLIMRRRRWWFDKKIRTRNDVAEYNRGTPKAIVANLKGFASQYKSALERDLEGAKTNDKIKGRI